MKALLLLISIVLMYLTQSCSKSDKVIIGFMTPNLDSDRYKKEQVFFSDKIKELGGEPLIASANNDDKLQIDQAIDMMNQGATVLVVDAVNLNTAASIVREAHKNNVKVIAYDRLIQNTELDYYMSFDNAKVGQLMAEYAIKVKPQGSYILLGGDKADKNAVMVKEGQMKVLEPSVKSGKIKIVYNIYIENWDNENAYHEIANYLDMSAEVPDVILASNDGMASGAIRALKERGLEKQVIVTGQDAELQACKNIAQGFQTMTVYKPFKNQVYIAASLAVKLAKNEKITEVTSTVYNGRIDVPAILIDPVSVDYANIKSTIVADGFLSEKEIFN
jgi:D-xylose transport system substrate-binding protein